MNILKRFLISAAVLFILLMPGTVKAEEATNTWISVTLDGSIGLNVGMQVYGPEAVNAKDLYFCYCIGNEEEKKISADKRDIYGGGWSVLTFRCDIPAKNINSSVKFRLYADGVAISEEKQVSVRDYALELKKQSKYAELADAMLAYGENAAAYWKIDGYTETYPVEEYETILDKVGELDSLENCYGVSLLLESGTILRQYFEKCVENAKQKENLYYTEEKISPAEFSREDKYSVNDYIYTVLADKTADVDLKNLCTALYQFGEAAKKYSVEQPEVPSTEESGRYEKKLAMDTFDEINDYRIAAGVEPLVWDDGIYEGAKIRAKELVTLFEHTRPDGTQSSTVLAGLSNEYKPAGGEIIAITYDGTSVAQLWYNSEGHRNSMLRSDVYYAATSIYCVDGAYYSVTMFACSTSQYRFNNNYTLDSWSVSDGSTITAREFDRMQFDYSRLDDQYCQADGSYKYPSSEDEAEFNALAIKYFDAQRCYFKAGGM